MIDGELKLIFFTRDVSKQLRIDRVILEKNGWLTVIFMTYWNGASAPVFTNHKPLMFVLKTLVAHYASRTIRQMVYIVQFIKEMFHNAGHYNVPANVSSRMHADFLTTIQ